MEYGTNHQSNKYFLSWLNVDIFTFCREMEEKAERDRLEQLEREEEQRRLEEEK